MVELEKLRRELAYRRQLNEQQNNMIAQQRAQLTMGQVRKSYFHNCETNLPPGRDGPDRSKDRRASGPVDPQADDEPAAGKPDQRSHHRKTGPAQSHPGTFIISLKECVILNASS